MIRQMAFYIFMHTIYVLWRVCGLCMYILCVCVCILDTYVRYVYMSYV